MQIRHYILNKNKINIIIKKVKQLLDLIINFFINNFENKNFLTIFCKNIDFYMTHNNLSFSSFLD